MEQKKTSKADLERKRNTFFMVGLVLALGAVLFAFEWTTKPTKVENLDFSNSSAEVEEEFIPITREKEVKPPPPEKTVVNIIEIVDNEIDIVDELEIEDSEADENTFIDIEPFANLVQEEEEKEEDRVFYSAEIPAEFPGGIEALYAQIRKLVKYPMIAQENGVQGKVYVNFVVNEQGKVMDAEILRSVDASLDAEALRVVNSLPDFRPASQGGRNVKMYYQAIINFQLQ